MIFWDFNVQTDRVPEFIKKAITTNKKKKWNTSSFQLLFLVITISKLKKLKNSSNTTDLRIEIA